MGQLIEGRWHSTEPPRRERDFVRQASVFRNWITPDGAVGTGGLDGFRAEPHRYHLYVSLACPWAHRTLIARALKGLEAMIEVSVVHWLVEDDGWTFAPGDGVIPDTVNDCRYLRGLYVLADPRCTSRVTVPVLWDKARRTIVSNESSEIIRMFNSAFDGVGAAAEDYFPTNLAGEIDALNARVYDQLNNGVYRAGFAADQGAYETSVRAVFDTLEALEALLSDGRRFILGDRLTEADIRLFPTLIRFDAVYFTHFKCNLRRIADYRFLSAYTRALHRHPSIRPTVNLQHIKKHYYQSHRRLNPSGIVPVGPLLDLD
jgi:putative glutathione S-transferase